MKCLQLLPAVLVTESPPSRGAWIEIASHLHLPVHLQSPPSRGAWIEIIPHSDVVQYPDVAPLAGGVD